MNSDAMVPAGRPRRAAIRRAGIPRYGAVARKLAWLAVALWLAHGTAQHAHAQTTTSNTATGSGPNPPVIGRIIDRLQGFRQNVSRRYWASYRDCINNDAYIFPVQLQDSGRRLEVWVGNDDCAARRGEGDANRGQCWIVASIDRPSTPQQDVVVPVRNIIARRQNTLTPPTDVGANVCDENTDPDGEKLTFYFILEENGLADAYTIWSNGDDGIGYDLVGPAPPTSIDVGVGEQQLAIRINGLNDEEDRERLEAFCVPEGTTLPEEPDASSPIFIPTSDAGDAGLDASATPGVVDGSDGGAPRECFTPLLRRGERPPIDFSCGVVNETTRTLRTSRLQNNTTYAVGVAGQDVLGNAGLLSEIQCGTPIELDDFFEVYSRSGGAGGGGFCSIGALGAAPARRGAASVGLLLLVAAALRRRTRAPR